ncbi:hypothetical protein BI347_07375 [Chromobacterium sphagni]|uniref:Uncharacterized protein n=1 Tax=Chromobacterium sphagni TaxID=1903179 RepID=A0A1S1X1P3_9NEIS|nr:hypothetical protein BI347_07375 [Chromobacterium sphagni]
MLKPAGNLPFTCVGRGLTGSILGVRLSQELAPWASNESPCGMVDWRTMVGGALGSLVADTFSQMPGSMCMPSSVAASLTCCR